MNQKLYSKITDALVDDGYIIIENALDNKLALALEESAKSQKDYKKAGVSLNRHVDFERRRDKIHWLDKSDVAQSQFLEFTSSLQEYLNHELYLGLSYYEAHFAIYDEGDFYETHLDAFKNSKNRVVTTVFYLNEEWDNSDGGELIVYDSENNYLATVNPAANTLVVFMSERFPHEVKPAKKRRYSIAGWFRVDKS